MYRFLSILVVLSAFVSCSGGVKSESISCNDGSVEQWGEEGYKTALAGKHIRSFDAHKERCGNSIGKEQRAGFIDGYTKGVIEYCTYDKGYELGMNNSDDPKICPYELQSAFNNGYTLGNRVYRERVKTMEKRAQDYDDYQYRDSFIEPEDN